MIWFNLNYLSCRVAGKKRETLNSMMFFLVLGKTLKRRCIKTSWPEAAGEIHIDAWRRADCVDGYAITVEEIVAVEKTKKIVARLNSGFYN